MAQATAAASGDLATALQVAEMRATIKKVRDMIARFHDTRRRNNERAAGLRSSMVHPLQVQQMLKSTRSAGVEAQAVDALKQFITLLQGREPTQEEMRQGIPEGYEDKVAMSGIGAVFAVVAVAVGGSVYSYFNYLATVEEGAQQRTATPMERVLGAVSDNVWGVAAVGAIALGGVIYWQARKSTAERQKAEIERYRAAGRALEKSMAKTGAGVEDEDESFTDKVKRLFQNAVFPPEKNPGLSPAQRLAVQFNGLSEGEQDRFYEIVEGGSEDHGHSDEADGESEDFEGSAKHGHRSYHLHRAQDESEQQEDTREGEEE